MAHRQDDARRGHECTAHRTWQHRAHGKTQAVHAKWKSVTPAAVEVPSHKIGRAHV